jgi:hypothetical protein
MILLALGLFLSDGTIGPRSSAPTEAVIGPLGPTMGAAALTALAVAAFASVAVRDRHPGLTVILAAPAALLNLAPLTGRGLSIRLVLPGLAIATLAGTLYNMGRSLESRRSAPRPGGSASRIVQEATRSGSTTHRPSRGHRTIAAALVLTSAFLLCTVVAGAGRMVGSFISQQPWRLDSSSASRDDGLDARRHGERRIPVIVQPGGNGGRDVDHEQLGASSAVPPVIQPVGVEGAGALGSAGSELAAASDEATIPGSHPGSAVAGATCPGLGLPVEAFTVAEAQPINDVPLPILTPKLRKWIDHYGRDDPRDFSSRFWSTTGGEFGGGIPAAEVARFLQGGLAAGVTEQQLMNLARGGLFSNRGYAADPFGRGGLLRFVRENPQLYEQVGDLQPGQGLIEIPQVHYAYVAMAGVHPTMFSNPELFEAFGKPYIGWVIDMEFTRLGRKAMAELVELALRSNPGLPGATGSNQMWGISRAYLVNVLGLRDRLLPSDDFMLGTYLETLGDPRSGGRLANGSLVMRQDQYARYTESCPVS